MHIEGKGNWGIGKYHFITCLTIQGNGKFWRKSLNRHEKVVSQKAKVWAEQRDMEVHCEWKTNRIIYQPKEKNTPPQKHLSLCNSHLQKEREYRNNIWSMVWSIFRLQCQISKRQSCRGKWQLMLSQLGKLISHLSDRSRAHEGSITSILFSPSSSGKQNPEASH